MAHRVDVYTATGTASGTVAGVGPVRDRLTEGSELALTGVTWQDLADLVPRPVADCALAADDLIIVVADDDPPLPVHASWHPVDLEAGPYVIKGELPTMPGFDPGRALTRPTGEFVLLRDVHLGLRARPELGDVRVSHALVNRYAVDRIAADLMLGFFFPGAASDAGDLSSAGAAG
jgi:hypothetical protein